MTAATVGPLRCPVLAGRRREWALVEAWLSGGCDEKILLLVGEPGIGKSRLLARCLREARDTATVVEGRCEDSDRLVPLGSALDLLRAPSAVPRAPTLRHDLMAVAPARDAGGDGPTGPDVELARRRLFERVADALSELAGERPVLLAVDDVHWADDGSLDLLGHLVRRLRDRDVRFVLTFRPEETTRALRALLTRLEGRRSHLELRLERLSRSDLADMVALTLETPRVPDRLLDLLTEVTSGIPFLVEEVLSSLARIAGSTEPSALARAAGGPLEVPRTVRATASERTQDLGDRGRDVLVAAAVAGSRVDRGVLAAVTGLEEEQVIAACEELCAAGLLATTGPGEYAFRHDLLRRAVYNDLRPRMRRHLHREVARAIEARAVGEPDREATALARHTYLAGDWEDAARFGAVAGAQSLRRYAPAAAAAHFGRAIDAIRELGRPVPWELHRDRARACELAGDLDGALEDRDAAVAATVRTGDRRAEWQARLDRATTHMARRWDEAGPDLRSAFSIAGELGDPVALGRTLNRLGNWHLNRGDLEEARAHHEEALELLDAHGGDRDTATSLDFLAVQAFAAGELTVSAELYERSQRLFRDLGDQTAVSNALAMRALCSAPHWLCTYRPAITYPDAVQAARRAVAIAREVRWPSGEAFALGNLGDVLAESGQLGEALTATAEAVALSGDLENPAWLCRSHLDHGLTLLDALAVEEVMADLEASVAWAGRSGVALFLGTSLAWLAVGQALVGDGTVAGATIDRALAADESRLTRRNAAYARLELALARGDPRTALAEVDRLLAGVPGSEPEREPPRLGLKRGRALLALDRPRQAAATLRRAVDVATWAGAPPVRWQCLAGLADAEDRCGHPDRARAAREQAREVVTELGASLDTDRAAAFRTRATEEIGDARSASPLTDRQHEVAALVARGLTNKQIAEELVISPLTAETHVKNILNRLGVGSRAEIATWATRRGLPGIRDVDRDTRSR